MLDWLQLPLDAAREHNVGFVTAWHGRLMVLAWSVVLPAGVIIARFYKITPRQKWPDQLDNKAWWYSHLTLQYTGGVIMLAAIGLIWQATSTSPWTAHTLLGWVAVGLGVGQFLSGWLRGTKGGPTAPGSDGTSTGDHYDMTRRRRAFEAAHKTAGYLALVMSMAAILTGFWLANAPRWMPLLWLCWLALLAGAWMTAQRRGLAADTYQAIWGPDLEHPGNRLAPNGACAGASA